MVRRSLLTGFVVVTVAVLAVLSVSVSWAQEKGPIKIGYIVPITGAFAENGKDMQNGAIHYLEEIGYQVAGRKIDLIVEDDEANPSTGMTKLRKVVEKDAVHVVAGVFLASTGYAFHPYIEEKKIPANYQICSADDLTQRKNAKWVVRTSWTSSQTTHAMGEYMYKTLGYRKIACVGMDYAFGWEAIGGLQRTFEEQGGKVVQKIWTPINTVDFSPYLSNIRSDVDAVYVVYVGRPGLTFAKQYMEFGLKKKIPLLTIGPLTDENILPSMGDEALGIVNALHYSAALDTPVNKKFVNSYRERFKRAPSYFAEGAYTGTRWIVESIKAIGGAAEDREKFLGAMRKMVISDAPRGPFKLDDYGNPVENVYVRKVERVKGELQNTVINTIPNVSQFWKYKPEDYLKQPLYSRDYTPGKP
jgi:branched-chain amino acid transport system substrate-binding protein